MAEREQVQILVVEDNPIDVRALLRAAKSLRTPTSIDVAVDGDEALAYLRAPDKAAPALVLLDLNLPGRDGNDVLAAMKHDAALKRIPVIVVSTSASDADVIGAYDAGANAYLNKPTSLDGWHEIIEALQAFWLSLVRLSPS